MNSKGQNTEDWAGILVGLLIVCLALLVAMQRCGSHIETRHCIESCAASSAPTDVACLKVCRGQGND
ncbi:MAG: hypothetical protein CL489_07005 [Acidobacteria bacterium]|nr:hypothetical protein [Acidobacteriota bacterium]